MCAGSFLSVTLFFPYLELHSVGQSQVQFKTKRSRQQTAEFKGALRERTLAGTRLAEL